LKSIIAYSSVSHICVILVVVRVECELMFSLSVVLMLIHACTRGSMFLLVREASTHSYTRCLYIYRSVIFSLPVVVSLLLLLLSMNFGMPPFVGFVVEIVCCYMVTYSMSIVAVI